MGAHFALSLQFQQNQQTNFEQVGGIMENAAYVMAVVSLAGMAITGVAFISPCVAVITGLFISGVGVGVMGMRIIIYIKKRKLQQKLKLKSDQKIIAEDCRRREKEKKAFTELKQRVTRLEELNRALLNYHFDLILL